MLDEVRVADPVFAPVDDPVDGKYLLVNPAEVDNPMDSDILINTAEFENPSASDAPFNSFAREEALDLTANSVDRVDSMDSNDPVPLDDPLNPANPVELDATVDSVNAKDSVGSEDPFNPVEVENFVALDDPTNPTE